MSGRNPTWSRDELLLALDLYVQTDGNPTGKDFEAVDGLSAILNKMHQLQGATGKPTLRNRNGVYLKVMNFRASDPFYLKQGKVGMTRGNALEAVLWAEYEGRHAALAADARQIRDAIGAADEGAVQTLPPADHYEGEEGGFIIALHKRYERDKRLNREKRRVAKLSGGFACEVCAFDFKAAYGDLGADFIEIHHTRPVHLMKAGQKTKLSDLALLCSNCHRMAHRRRTPLTVAELKAVRTKMA